MNGRFSVIPGKDVTMENLVYYQSKPTSSKLFHTQTYSKSFFAVCYGHPMEQSRPLYFCPVVSIFFLSYFLA